MKKNILTIFFMFFMITGIAFAETDSATYITTPLQKEFKGLIYPFKPVKIKITVNTQLPELSSNAVELSFMKIKGR